MYQVRHYNLDTGHTEDIGEPVPNKKFGQALAKATQLDDASHGDRDMYSVAKVAPRTAHVFPVAQTASCR